MNSNIHPWAEELESLHAHAWRCLTRGVRDRLSQARHPTLATVSTQGWPEVRTVVLRRADQSSAQLDIHTHMRSPKVSDLRATPVAALHVWDASSRLQIRLHADAEVTGGDEVAQTWLAVPDASRTAYGVSTPGIDIPSAMAYDPTPDPTAFAVVRLSVRVMDLLHLGTQHRRARFTRDEHWVGRWLVP